MNIKLLFNKALEKSFFRQIGLFFIFNVIVFCVCYSLYSFCEPVKFGEDKIVEENGTKKVIEKEVGPWEAMRLFVDSNASLDVKEPHRPGSLLLFLLECCGTILFGGLIVSVFTNVIDNKVDNIKKGLIHYKLKDHVVIIGYDVIVPSIISQIVKNKAYDGCKILLQTSDSVEEVKNSLKAKLSLKELNRVVFIYAPRQSYEELKLLYTTDARSIYIVGDRDQDDHDAKNMNTFEDLVTIHKDVQATGKEVKTLPLIVWFENEASYAALQLNDISDQWKTFFSFRPYNFYKHWANRLLVESCYKSKLEIKYPELDHDGISADSNKHVHLIIIGMNRMGYALGKEAAHLLHFPNFDETTGKNVTRITFIDDNADREMDFFKGRLPGYFNVAPTIYTDLTENYPGNGFVDVPTGKNGQVSVKNFLDVQFEFVKGRVESPYVRKWLKQQLLDDDAIISIAICINNPSQSFGMAMYLPEEVYLRGRDNINNPWKVQDGDKIVNIFVRQETTDTLLRAFGDAAKTDSAKNRRYSNLYPFGMGDESFSLDQSSNELAMAFKYIYDYYFAHNDTLPTVIPETSELEQLWQSESMANKWSNLYLAHSIEFKLRSMGLDFDSVVDVVFTENQIDEIARIEHSRWNMEKLLLGFRALTAEERADDSVDKNILKKYFFAHKDIDAYGALTPSSTILDKNIAEMLPMIIKQVFKK